MALDEEKPVDRRRFFRLGLSELMRPLAKAAQPLERIARELGKLDQPTAEANRQRVMKDVLAAAAGIVAGSQIPRNLRSQRGVRRRLSRSRDPN